MDPYLLGLRLEGRRVLVVGGGAVATRRIPALLDAGADVVLVSPAVTASLEDLAASGRIRWEPRDYADGDCADAWLVCACTDDAVVNAAVAAAADRQRTWYVRADDAQASAAWTPAAGRVEDLEGSAVGGSAVGGSAVGGSAVGGSAVGGSAVGTRAVQVGVVSGDPRRSAAIRDAIVSGLRTGQLSARRVRGHRAGVAIIGGGPGDPGLITVRGRQLLAEADVVLTDRLAPRSLLDELPADVEIIDVSKIPYGRAMAQEQINATLIDRARAGRFVARLKGGDPFVFGRGAEEALACLRARHPGHRGAGSNQRGGRAHQRLGAGDPPGRSAGVPRRVGPRPAGRRSVYGGLGAARRQLRDLGAADGRAADRGRGGRAAPAWAPSRYTRLRNRRRDDADSAHN